MQENREWSSFIKELASGVQNQWLSQRRLSTCGNFSSLAMVRGISDHLRRPLNSWTPRILLREMTENKADKRISFGGKPGVYNDFHIVLFKPGPCDFSTPW